MRAVYDRLSVLPSYSRICPGAECTYSRLALEVLHTIDGYEEYMAITAEFAVRLREMLRSELRRLISIPVGQNSIIKQQLSAADIERLSMFLS